MTRRKQRNPDFLFKGKPFHDREDVGLAANPVPLYLDDPEFGYVNTFDGGAHDDGLNLGDEWWTKELPAVYEGRWRF